MTSRQARSLILPILQPLCQSRRILKKDENAEQNELKVLEKVKMNQSSRQQGLQKSICCPSLKRIAANVSRLQQCRGQGHCQRQETNVGCRARTHHPGRQGACEHSTLPFRWLDCYFLRFFFFSVRSQAVIQYCPPRFILKSLVRMRCMSGKCPAP